MARAPLDWLLSIGDSVLLTSAKTLTGAINELFGSLANFGSQTNDSLASLDAKKVNKTDALNLEEIEASTELTDKVAAASAVKLLDEQLGGFSFYTDPSIVYNTAGSEAPYKDADGNYILADSPTGAALIATAPTTTAAYISKTIAGRYYSVGGADSVTPFKKPTSVEAPKTIKISSKAGSGSPCITSGVTFTLTLGANGKYTVTRNTDKVSVKDSGGAISHGYALGSCTVSQS